MFATLPEGGISIDTICHPLIVFPLKNLKHVGDYERFGGTKPSGGVGFGPACSRIFAHKDLPSQSLAACKNAMNRENASDPSGFVYFVGTSWLNSLPCPGPNWEKSCCPS